MKPRSQVFAALVTVVLVGRSRSDAFQQSAFESLGPGKPTKHQLPPQHASSVLTRPCDDGLEIQRVEPLKPKQPRQVMKRGTSSGSTSSTLSANLRAATTRTNAAKQSQSQRGSTSSLSSLSVDALLAFSTDKSEYEITNEIKRLVSASAEASAATLAVSTTEKTSTAINPGTTMERNGQQKRGRSIPAFSGLHATSARNPKVTKRNVGATARIDLVVSPISEHSSRRSPEQAPTFQNYSYDHGDVGGNGYSHNDYGNYGSSATKGRRRKRSNTNFGRVRDFQRIYRSDLLTCDEEYTLGTQIQFMIACGDVHEGLATRLGRLPTFGEWAAACGYTKMDPKFKATEADESLRPAGSEKMFIKIDPCWYEGKRRAGDSGPGKGNGRVKRIPLARLKDFRADSFIPPSQQPQDRDSCPVNRGTTRDFLDAIVAGREAKQNMIKSNMRLVVSIARKYASVDLGLQDLVQEGAVGLSRAAEKFDPHKGFKFSTYASWWIRQAVFRSIAYHSRTIRLPVHIHNMVNRIHRVQKKLHAHYGRSPTSEEMAFRLGMSLEKYNKFLRLTKQSISLDVPKYTSNPKDLGHEGDDTLGDTVDASELASELASILSDDIAPEMLVDQTLFLDDLKTMLQVLEKDERLVLCARYGLLDGMARTVTSVAALMNQSAPWVRSLECRALRKLRRPWYEKKLKEHERSLCN